MLQPSTLKFLRDLKKNNNKPWFDAHRSDYESAKKDFEAFINQLIQSHAKKDSGLKHLSAKDCMFRIYRDTRFSKDKSPYKTNFGASINKNGRKAWNSAGYYCHLEPGNSFIGGGMYMPEPAVLSKMRQEIDYNFASFKKILANKKFKTVYGKLSTDDDLTLSRVPKGYEPDHPAAEFLKLKSYIAMAELKDADLTSKNLLKKATASFEALQPLVEFINQTVE